jgi:hypothetical protein
MKQLLFSVTLMFTLFVSAQVTNQVDPASWSLGLSQDVPQEVMPAIDLASYVAEDAINDAELIKKPYRFGAKINVALDLFNSGQWTELENGDRIWRLQVKSTGARTINFMMDRYELPPGAQMFIYNDDRSDKIGPYTAAENQEDGVLGTWIVYGDHVWLEYYEPVNVRGLGRISIDTVVHGYRGFGGAEDAFLKLNESGACNVDVMCNPNQGSSNGVNWNTVRDNYRHAVARILINGSGLCTGTLVNNVREDGTPYFLTADHCLGNAADGSGSSYPANGWSFGFDWYTNTPDCATFANTSGPFNPTRVLSGAQLRSNRGATDVALFELNQTPPASWDLYYAGWSRASSAPTAQLCMHHPSGDIMKLARNDQSATPVTVSGVQCWNVANWDYGVTEGGSSGSCLINPNGHIVGTLLGGSAACNGVNDNNAPDYYGRIDLGWTAGSTASTRLRDWLDPDNTGAVSYDGDYTSTLSNDDIFGQVQISIFPNPTTDRLFVQIEERANYSIYNLAGKLIVTGSLTAGTNELSLAGVANGVYFFSVNNGARQSTLKFIKE